MCQIINFSQYKGTKAGMQLNSVKRLSVEGGDKNIRELVSAKWYKEYFQKGWGLSKLIYHIIGQYGYIRCGRNEAFVFEEIKSDVPYYKIYPEVENKKLKAPLWVKVKGEWYFVEAYTDCASNRAINEKRIETGNYDMKGFYVDLYGLNKKKIKEMLAQNDIKGAVKEICRKYEEGYHDVINDLDCRASVCFGEKRNQRECTYKLAELKRHEYAILEGTELESGDKHLVLLSGSENAKEYAVYFKEKYKDAGLSLFYGQWEPTEENWRGCIRRQEKLYRRPVTD